MNAFRRAVLAHVFQKAIKTLLLSTIQHRSHEIGGNQIRLLWRQLAIEELFGTAHRCQRLDKVTIDRCFRGSARAVPFRYSHVASQLLCQFPLQATVAHLHRVWQPPSSPTVKSAVLQYRPLHRGRLHQRYVAIDAVILPMTAPPIRDPASFNHLCEFAVIIPFGHHKMVALPLKNACPASAETTDFTAFIWSSASSATSLIVAGAAEPTT